MEELKENIVSLLVELRNDCIWNENLWLKIVKEITSSIEVWNKTGNVPKTILPYFIDLAEDLAGGNRFIDYDTAIKVEDASIQLQELFNELLDE